MRKKYTQKFVESLLLEKNIKLHCKYKNCKQKLDVECLVCGLMDSVRWSPEFTNIKNRGDGCPQCSKNLKPTQEFIENFLLGKKIKLYDKYKNCKQKLDVECLNCGFHDFERWAPRLDNIQNGQTGCPDCYGNLKPTQKFVENFLLRKDIKLHSKYKNNRQKLDVECLNCGFHDFLGWAPTFNSIKSKGSGCPHCCSGKTQKHLFEILQKLENGWIFGFKNFDWLLGPKNKKRMEIDCWNPTRKIAIEYDGRQHYEPVLDFGGIKEFQKIQERDIRKNNLIASHPEDVKYFIRIPYWEPVTEENVKRILTENGVISFG